MRVHSTILVFIAAVVGLVVARPAIAAPPHTAPSQAEWLADASRRTPVAADEVAAHLSPALLASLGVDGFNAMLTTTGHLTFTGLRPQPMRENEQVFGLADDGNAAALAITAGAFELLR